MRRMRTLGLAGALLVHAGLAAGAQAQTVPGLPTLTYAGKITEVRAQYHFSGCASGAVAERPSTIEFGTPYCVNGVLTIGVGPFSGIGQTIQSTLDLAYALNPLVHHSYQEANMPVWGTVTNTACPTGCATTFLVADFMDQGTRPRPSQLSFWESLIAVDLSTVYSLDRINPQITYWPESTRGVPAGQSTSFSQFALTAVPEPSTYALFATGLLGLAGVAYRKRKA